MLGPGKLWCVWGLPGVYYYLWKPTSPKPPYNPSETFSPINPTTEHGLATVTKRPKTFYPEPEVALNGPLKHYVTTLTFINGPPGKTNAQGVASSDCLNPTPLKGPLKATLIGLPRNPKP